MIPVLNTSLPQAPAGDSFAQRLVNRLDRLLREIDMKVEIFKQSLSNVDNTSDVNKPVSTATQTALNLKSNSANPSFTGRITGDFSNATQSNRLMFQTTTANAVTNVGSIPNGTSTVAAWTAFSSSDPTNASVVQIGVDHVGNGQQAWLSSTKNGTGTYLPLVFYTSGNERLRIDTAGNTRPGANNAYNLGDSSYRWATIYAQNALNTSDVRLKTDIVDSTLGLDFINKLRPVQFRWIEGGNKVIEEPEFNEDGTPLIDEDGTHKHTSRLESQPGQRTHFGFIAQEVKDAIPSGANFGLWALADKNDPDSIQSISLQQFIGPLVKAVQEQQRMIDALSKQVGILRAGN